VSINKSHKKKPKIWVSLVLETNPKPQDVVCDIIFIGLDSDVLVEIESPLCLCLIRGEPPKE